MAKLLIFTLISTLAFTSGNPLDSVKYYFNSPTDEIFLPPESVDQLLPPINSTHLSAKFFVHGWVDDNTAYWYQPIIDKYLQRGERNLIAVDWGKYAAEFYPFAVEYVHQVGADLGHAIVYLHQVHGIPLEAVHLIGHSLGAHVVGFAGQFVYNATGKKVGRISGLDPAGPLFNGARKDERLSVDDALFVDVIHTATLLLGYKTAMGHVDFWPNGGSSQPGCDSLSTCSHLRAPLYFADSVGHVGEFPAWFCDSMEMFKEGRCFQNRKVEMGDATPTNLRGNFFLETIDKPAYHLYP